MPKVVAQMTVKDTMNAPAIPKAGSPRATSHSNRGSTTASGSNESQDPVWWVTACKMIKARSESTPAASMDSAQDGGFSKPDEGQSPSARPSQFRPRRTRTTRAKHPNMVQRNETRSLSLHHQARMPRRRGRRQPQSPVRGSDQQRQMGDRTSVQSTSPPTALHPRYKGPLTAKLKGSCRS